jgi:hypothetical protein
MSTLWPRASAVVQPYSYSPEEFQIMIVPSGRTETIASWLESTTIASKSAIDNSGGKLEKLSNCRNVI